MSLHRSIDDFPEAVGQIVPCCACHEPHAALKCVSVRYIVPVSETKGQVQMSLLCGKCILINFQTIGRC